MYPSHYVVFCPQCTIVCGRKCTLAAKEGTWHSLGRVLLNFELVCDFAALPTRRFVHRTVDFHHAGKTTIEGLKVSVVS